MGTTDLSGFAVYVPNYGHCGYDLFIMELLICVWKSNAIVASTFVDDLDSAIGRR